MNSTDIARLAGVSRSTVSRVVNGYANVPEETRARVMAVIEEYGYEPNDAARKLAGKPSTTVGFIIVDMDPENTNVVRSSPFLSEFLIHTADRLQARGCQLLLSIVRRKEQFRNIIGLMSGQTVSGAMLMGDLVPLAVVKELAAGPGALLLHNQRNSITVPGVILLNTENYEGAFAAAEFLFSCGHRRIAHIGGPLDRSSTRDRFKGYRDCLRRHGIEPEERFIAANRNIHRIESGYAAAHSIFRSDGGRPTALFCANDLMALGAMKALSEMGLRVPEDVSVIGYDNIESCRHVSPELSSIDINLELLADMAIDSLCGSIENGRGETRVLVLPGSEVVARDSVAPLKN